MSGWRALGAVVPAQPCVKRGKGAGLEFWQGEGRGQDTRRGPCRRKAKAFAPVVALILMAFGRWWASVPLARKNPGLCGAGRTPAAASRFSAQCGNGFAPMSGEALSSASGPGQAIRSARRKASNARGRWSSEALRVAAHERAGEPCRRRLGPARRRRWPARASGAGGSHCLRATQPAIRPPGTAALLVKARARPPPHRGSTPGAAVRARRLSASARA